MASAFQPALLPAPALRTARRRSSMRLLPQYLHLDQHALWPLMKVAMFLTGVTLVMYSGLFVALGGTLALKFVAVPVTIFTVLIMWLLPDVAKTANPPVQKLVWAFLAMNVLWPAYLAIVIPGLPWLTPPRIALGVMLVIMMIYMPQYADFRQRIWAVMGHDRVAARLMMSYAAITFLVIPTSFDPSRSAPYAVLQLVQTLSPVILLAWLLYDPANLPRFTRVMVVTVIIVMVIGVLENYMQKPPWVDYIPSFISLDPDRLASIASPQARSGDTRYRVRSTFTVVLYFTLYLNLLMPLLMHSIWQMRKKHRFLALALVPLILHTAWFANARTAMIPLFTSLFGLIGLNIIRTWFFRKDGDHLHKMITIGGMVTAILMAGLLVASSHTLQLSIFGGGQHRASNATRDAQWEKTWVQMRKNPFGAGLTSAGALAGTRNTAIDIPTVDSYWINQLVDTGFLGFGCYFGAFLWVAWRSIKGYMKSDHETEDWLAPFALSLINYFIACYVISYDDNNYLAFSVAVAALSILRRKAEREAAQPKAVAASPDTGHRPGTWVVAR
ncbi:O-antigen ligase family protein [Sandarakinorhabdus rubra]|uniref:O-antigen ligase family protein n=1 Tax=Sandarakinorhabdus rubra TaxID=2672568 RepID=UPI0013DAC85B|nr:hypothetical protein [Sandarakinorhabdus rubra]